MAASSSARSVPSASRLGFGPCLLLGMLLVHVGGPLVVLGVGNRENRAGQREQRDGVGQHHELVEHVLQLPDEVDLEHRTQEHEESTDAGEHENRLLAKEVFPVELREQVPRQNRREREEQQAYGDEDVAAVGGEELAERHLGHVAVVQADGRGQSGGVAHVLVAEHDAALRIDELSVLERERVIDGVAFGHDELDDGVVLAGILVGLASAPSPT